MQIFGLGHALDLINVLKQSTKPVYAWNRIWSKTNYSNFESIFEIPYQDFDEIDNDVTIAIKLSRDTNECSTVTHNDPNGNPKVIVNHTPNEISVAYYYPNGKQKHLTGYLNRKLHGTCRSWYPSGQLKEETIYIENVAQVKTTYHLSGNIEMVERYHRDNAWKSIKRWYDNGQVEFENNVDGTSLSYTKRGVLTSRSIRTGDINAGGHVISWEYDANGVIKKESKQYYTGGLLHGYERSFYDIGELKRDVDYTNGHTNKVIKNFKKNGELSVK